MFVELILTWGADPKVGGVTLLLSTRFASGSERIKLLLVAMLLAIRECTVVVGNHVRKDQFK